ncbi:MAG: thiamine-phosphate kinase [Burkholderiaceae bacterium]
MGEFDLIERYFKAPARAMRPNDGVALGIGDDCALLQPTVGMQLAISSDMLIEGRHFFADVDPSALGHKALAVNLSDLAACGAKPLAFTLALSMPKADEAWLAPFSRGLLTLAAKHNCALIGGDTTQGPLNICITVFGEVPKNMALLRSGAKAGDDIYVSGTLGDARLALEAMRGNVTLTEQAFATARKRLESPIPRVTLGIALRGIASSAIDVSDGLLGDLGHILKKSHVGAVIDTSIAMELIANKSINTLATTQLLPQFTSQKQMQYIFSGGDDYELAFTAPASQRSAVQAAAAASNTPVTRIGQIEAALGLRLIDDQGKPVKNSFESWDHFQ